MPRPIQTSVTRSRFTHSIAAMGDSLTYNAELGVWGYEFYPERVAVALRALSGYVCGRNFGRSGNTTGQMVQRFARMSQFDVPVIALIWGGTNDAQYNTTVQGGSTASVINVGAGFGQRYIAGSYMTINAVSRQILSVAVDAVTLVTALGGAPTVGQVVAIDTQTNLTTMIAAIKAAGCSRVVVIAQHYLNYSAGGDTLAVPYPANVTLRALQSAAASAGGSGVVYCDLYTWMRNLIVAGTYVQGSFSWHVADLNVHLNAIGEQIVADAVMSTINAQNGWLAALQ